MLTTYGHYLLAQKDAPLEARKCFKSVLEKYQDGKPSDYSRAEAEHGLAMVEFKAGHIEQAQIHAKNAMDVYTSLFGQTLDVSNEKHAIRQARRMQQKVGTVLQVREQMVDSILAGV